MFRLFTVAVIFAGLEIFPVSACRAVAPVPVDDDERLLASARVGGSGPALVEFLQMSLAGLNADLLRVLVRRLDGPDADGARANLIASGHAALPVLLEAQKDARLGRKAREQIEDCLKWLDGPLTNDLHGAVVRRLGRVWPAGASEVLFAFVAAAEADEATVEEARAVLVARAVRGGKVDPVLGKAALEDSNPERRRCAIDVLCRADAGEVIRRLYRDESAEIRVHTASARLDLGDPEAVPVLIELLGTEPKSGQPGALAALRRLAGPLAPDLVHPGALSVVRPGAPERAAPASVQAMWRAWWRDADGEAQLRFFRERTPDFNLLPRDQAHSRLDALAEQLGGESFEERNQAEKDLIALRGLAIPWLEKAAKHSDLERRRRAERALKEIRVAPEAPAAAARTRLLGLRRPAGAARVLLAYVAFADAEAVTEEVVRTLCRLARHDPATRPVLRTALADWLPQRRRVAVQVLAEIADEADLHLLRKRLADTDPVVRWATARGLLRHQERQAVPVLIDLLTVLSLDHASEVEDLLFRLAGSAAPVVPLRSSEESRKKCCAAWTAWWKDHGARVRLIDPATLAGDLGLTLLSLWDGSPTNSVVELGRDRKERWRIDNLGYAFDFIVLPGQRLLLAENTANRVTERNFQGDILWQFDIPGPINCQRLPNGHTFIAASGKAVIVDRDKKEVTTFAHGGLSAGQRLRDGTVVLATNSEFHVFDATGKAIRSFPIPEGLNNTGGMQALPNGRFLLAQYSRNRVTEFDLSGKEVWSCATPSPNFANRQPNGHTLITSQVDQSLIEVDRNGKKVGEYRPGKSVWQVRRR
jgi:HEAT repeat protein